MLVLGLGDGFKNQEIMKMRVSGLSNDEIGVLLYQSEAETIDKAIKSIIQIHFPHKWPKKCHNYYLMFFHLILLWFSYDFLCFSHVVHLSLSPDNNKSKATPDFFAAPGLLEVSALIETIIDYWPGWWRNSHRFRLREIKDCDTLGIGYQSNIPNPETRICDVANWKFC